jgi:hypothetical protein
MNSKNTKKNGGLAGFESLKERFFYIRITLIWAILLE